MENELALIPSLFKILIKKPNGIKIKINIQLLKKSALGVKGKKDKNKAPCGAFGKTVLLTPLWLQ